MPEDPSDETGRLMAEGLRLAAEGPDPEMGARMKAALEKARELRDDDERRVREAASDQLWRGAEMDDAELAETLTEAFRSRPECQTTIYPNGVARTEIGKPGPTRDLRQERAVGEAIQALREAGVEDPERFVNAEPEPQTGDGALLAGIAGQPAARPDASLEALRIAIEGYHSGHNPSIVQAVARAWALVMYLAYDYARFVLTGQEPIEHEIRLSTGAFREIACALKSCGPGAPQIERADYGRGNEFIDLGRVRVRAKPEV